MYHGSIDVLFCYIMLVPININFRKTLNVIMEAKASQRRPRLVMVALKFLHSSKKARTILFIVEILTSNTTKQG